MQDFKLHPQSPMVHRPHFIALIAAIFLVQISHAQIADSYYNTANYFSGSGAPQINATNFINDYGGNFNVQFTNINSGGWLPALYQNWSYVRNFTNFNYMECNTGFRFERRVPGNTFWADNFYNEANIFCGTNNSTLFNLFGFNFNSVYWGIQVGATNIFNSGTILVGENGLAKFAANNLLFYRGIFQLLNSYTPNGSSRFGLGTNNWFPASSLGISTAFSGFFAQSPFFLTLTNSKSYFVVTPNGSPTNLIVRMVFIQNNNTNTACNVYFTNAAAFDFGSGAAYIEWHAPYFNLRNLQQQTNYLYLNNNYLLAASSNLQQNANGIPLNYSFTATKQPIGLSIPAVSGFPPVMPDVVVSNNYFSYVDARFTGTSVATNSALNGVFSNMVGRAEINVPTKMRLELSDITGMNYLRLSATNHFETDGNSPIFSPISDIYLGVTNNSFAFSNVLAGIVPNWSGYVQAWSTRWGATDGFGTTYDFRILIVNSDLSPTNRPIVQDCLLSVSNNLVISDILDVVRKFSANCTNLVITTNDLYSGAASPRGELYLDQINLNWQDCLPRLRVLTNSGGIYTMNLANYGSNSLPYFNFINNGSISNANGAFVFADNIENNGYFSAGDGSASFRSTRMAMTNGLIIARNSLTNVTGSFVFSNSSLMAGRSLTVVATNQFVDLDGTNSFWSVGAGNTGSGVASGLVVPILPPVASILGTTITNFASAGSSVNELWPAKDFGAVNSGFSNNLAVGKMIFSCQDSGNLNRRTQFVFSGTGVSNAIYVDCLVFQGFATNVDASYNVNSFVFTNNNIVIYYAQALMNGESVAEKINHKNGDRLRWIPTYAGTFSSTNLVYPPGVTNVVNAALAQSSSIDSDGDGIPNGSDPTPFLISPQVNLTISPTNVPPNSFRVLWPTIPNATNQVFYKTNLLSPNWIPFTNFGRWYFGSSVTVTNTAGSNWFASPQGYPGPVTNVWFFDPLTNGPRYYRVMVSPWLTYPY